MLPGPAAAGALAALLLTPALGAAAGGGRAAADDARLLAKRQGSSVCLAYIGHDARRVDGCLRPARAGVVRVRHLLRSCGEPPPGILGIAPEGTRKVNLSFAGQAPPPIRLRVWRIPRRIHPAGGTAFVVRRNVDGTSPILTAYDAAGQRLAQFRGRLPIPQCVKLRRAVPARAGR